MSVSPALADVEVLPKTVNTSKRLPVALSVKVPDALKAALIAAAGRQRALSRKSQTLEPVPSCELEVEVDLGSFGDSQNADSDVAAAAEDQFWAWISDMQEEQQSRYLSSAAQQQHPNTPGTPASAYSQGNSHLPEQLVGRLRVLDLVPIAYDHVSSGRQSNGAAARAPPAKRRRTATGDNASAATTAEPVEFPFRTQKLDKLPEEVYVAPADMGGLRWELAALGTYHLVAAKGASLVDAASMNAGVELAKLAQNHNKVQLDASGGGASAVVGTSTRGGARLAKNGSASGKTETSGGERATSRAGVLSPTLHDQVQAAHRLSQSGTIQVDDAEVVPAISSEPELLEHLVHMLARGPMSPQALNALYKPNNDRFTKHLTQLADFMGQQWLLKREMFKGVYIDSFADYTDADRDAVCRFAEQRRAASLLGTGSYNSSPGKAQGGTANGTARPVATIGLVHVTHGEQVRWFRFDDTAAVSDAYDELYDEYDSVRAQITAIRTGFAEARDTLASARAKHEAMCKPGSHAEAECSTVQAATKRILELDDKQATVERNLLTRHAAIEAELRSIRDTLDHRGKETEDR